MTEPIFRMRIVLLMQRYFFNRNFKIKNRSVDFAFQTTPQCKVCNSSYEFVVISKNKILRDFWETQSLKNGLNRRFWKKIASLWLRHLRFESLYLCHYLGTFVFRGFFMPEYCFLRWYSGIFSLPQNLVRVFERF